jgi:hypothetical protein
MDSIKVFGTKKWFSPFPGQYIIQMDLVDIRASTRSAKAERRAGGFEGPRPNERFPLLGILATAFCGVVSFF